MKINAFQLLFFFLLCFVVRMGFAQDISMLKAPVPKSPNVASLLKFDEHPVSISSGIPEVNIPIYTISSGELSWPISLRYHGGGVKVTDVASWVGMGWSLNFGGVIAQNIKGVADNYIGSDAIGRLNSLNTDMQNPSICDLKLLAENIRDAEPDIFTFSFNGKSGQFYYNDNSRIVQIPQQRLKIEGNASGPFQITDLDGTKYIFGAREEVIVQSISINSSGIIDPSQIDPARNNPRSTQVSYYLSQIVKTNGDVITFTYEGYSTEDIKYLSDTKNIVGNMSDPTFCEPSSEFRSITKNYQLQRVSSQRIKTITFRGGRIEFITGANRCDLYGDKILDRVIVYDSENTKVKEIKLSYKYFVGSNIYEINQLTDPNDRPEIVGQSSITNEPYKKNRLFLDKVTELNAQNGQDEFKYQLEYINNFGLPDRYSAEQDWWGYYNNNKLSSMLDGIFQDPMYGPYTYEYTTNSRNPNLEYAKQGSLSKITYPTGGYAEFEFEQNTTKNDPLNSRMVVHNLVRYTRRANPSDNYMGEFTVNNLNFPKKMIQFRQQYCRLGIEDRDAGFRIVDDNNNVVISSSQLGSFQGGSYPGNVTNPNDVGYREINIPLSNGHYRLFWETNWNACSYYVEILPYTDYEAPKTIYPSGGIRVKKSKLFDPVAGNSLIKKFEYEEMLNGVMTSTGKSGGVGSFTVGYKYKLSVCVTGGNTTGIPSGENVAEVFVISSNPIFPVGNVYYDKVVERRIDNMENDLGYTKYTYLNNGDLIFSSYLTKNFQNLVLSSDRWGAPLYNVYDYSWYRNKLIKKEDFAKVQGQYKSVLKEEYFYLPKYTDTLQALSTNYYLKGYGSSGTGITCPATGQFISTYEKINYSPYSIYSGYLLLDSVSVVEMFDNNNISKNKKYEYSIATLLPSKIEELNSMQLQKNIKMFKYAGDFIGVNNDAYGISNLLQRNIIGANIEQSEYILDIASNSRRLISSVFSSFNQSLPTLFNVSKIDMKNSLTDFAQAGLNANNLVRDSRYSTYVNFDRYDEKDNLSEQHFEKAPHTCYLWSYNRLYPVIEIKNLNYTDIENILGTTAINNFGNLINPGKSEIDAFILPLKTGLPNVLITTYTYKPLVGMTSQTDAKGMTTYYEYDAFQHLKTIKDQNGNILKQTDYHYKN